MQLSINPHNAAAPTIPMQQESESFSRSVRWPARVLLKSTASNRCTPFNNRNLMFQFKMHGDSWELKINRPEIMQLPSTYSTSSNPLTPPPICNKAKPPPVPVNGRNTTTFDLSEIIRIELLIWKSEVSYRRDFNYVFK